MGQDLKIVALTQEDTLAIAQLRPLTKSVGLSLGDRACIALGQRLGLPILTGDRVWTTLEWAGEVRLIR